MVNKKLLHEVVMNFIPTKKGITPTQLEVKFKGPKPELGKSINGGSKIKETTNQSEKTELIKKSLNKYSELSISGGNVTVVKQNITKPDQPLDIVSGGNKTEVKQTESMKKYITKPAQTSEIVSGGNKTEVKQTESMKKYITKPSQTSEVISGGNKTEVKQAEKVNSQKKNNINHVENTYKRGGNISKTNSNNQSNTQGGELSKKHIKETTHVISKKNNKETAQPQLIKEGGVYNKNSKETNINKTNENEKKKSLTTNIINDYKPSKYKNGGDSQKKTHQISSKKNSEHSLVKQYILKNGGEISNNNEQNIPKNSYRSITIPMDTKNKSEKKKSAGSKKTSKSKKSKSKKRSSRKKSNIKIKSSAPNNLKNDIDNLIRSSKKMAFHRVY